MYILAQLAVMRQHPIAPRYGILHWIRLRGPFSCGSAVPRRARGEYRSAEELVEPFFYFVV